MIGRQRGVALGLFVLLSAIYLLTFSGTYHSSDEISMLVATDSLARRGAWDIDLIRWMGEQQGSFGPDGHLYSRKGIGTTLAALPLYWLATQSMRTGNVQAAMLTFGLVTALTAVLVYLTIRRLGYREGPALGVGLAYGLATMAWPYARYLFSETLAALGLMVSTYALECFGSPEEPAPGPGTRLTRGEVLLPLLAGAGLGVAILARLNNAIFAPFFGLVLLAYSLRRYKKWQGWLKPMVLFAIPALLALAVTAWYNWLRFGDPLTTGYLAEERFATPFLQGFYGLVLSPGKGLLWYNPLLFASLAAWPALFRRHRAPALLVAAVVLTSVAFYASWYLWWAGHSWGPRFLVTILPLAVLPLAVALDACRRHRILAIGLAALAAAGVAVQIPAVAVDFNRYLEAIHARLGLYHPATLFNPAYSPLLRQWDYLPALGSPGGRGELDLAWARGGTVNWAALGIGLSIVVLAALVLLAGWRRRLSIWAGLGALGLLALAAAGSLLLYAPAGDVAQSAQALAAMERPDEAVVVTDPLLTEAFQDAYDGRLKAWGMPDWSEAAGTAAAVWTLGPGSTEPAEGRFQVGSVRLDLHLPPGSTLEPERLPAPSSSVQGRLGDVAELTAGGWSAPGGATVHGGEMLPVSLYWRSLAPTDASYTVTVQAIGEGEVKAGQVDRLPCNGGCPTTDWQTGDVIGERYELPIQPDAPPGLYQIVVGMYDLNSGERLPASDAEGTSLGPYLKIGSVTVEP